MSCVNVNDMKIAKAFEVFAPLWNESDSNMQSAYASLIYRRCQSTRHPDRRTSEEWRCCGLDVGDNLSKDYVVCPPKHINTLNQSRWGNTIFISADLT